MSKRLPTLQVEEIPGDQFVDREAAQRAALHHLSENLQTVIRNLLERGDLVNDNGTIKPRAKRRMQING